jgi:hypothetical protein
MADETPEAIQAEIKDLKRLARLVTDANVRAEIQKMIDELERRLREWRGIEPPRGRARGSAVPLAAE